MQIYHVEICSSCLMSVSEWNIGVISLKACQSGRFAIWVVNLRSLKSILYWNGKMLIALHFITKCIHDLTSELLPNNVWQLFDAEFLDLYKIKFFCCVWQLKKLSQMLSSLSKMNYNLHNKTKVDWDIMLYWRPKEMYQFAHKRFCFLSSFNSVVTKPNC